MDAQKGTLQQDEQKELYDLFKYANLLQDSLDLPNSSQFNFSVYKYKHYRWQKRILQIDLTTKIIFNIEKGIIKKQFPFSQVKSCMDGEGRRFRINFHGRQDYELEAASLEDKNKITHLVSKAAQSNVCGRPAEHPPDSRDVIHEGLLDLQLETPTSIKWVKHLVQLREQELTLHCIGQYQTGVTTPAIKTINLSNGDTVVSKEDGSSTFSLQTKEVKYLFQIPFTIQNNKADDIGKLRNEWLMLLDRHCSLLKDGSLTQHNISEVEYEKTPYLSEGEMEKPPCLLVGFPADSLAVTQQGSCLGSVMTQLPVMITTTEAPPPFPKSSNLLPASARTKIFHWDVVPQEKLQKSMWTSCHLAKKDIDEGRLYDQFHVQHAVGLSGGEPLKQHIMLNPKIAHNFNIFLKSFHIKPSQLKGKLYIIHEDSGGLSDEQITALRRYQPTAKDIEMYQSFKGSPSDLHTVDQFMLEMCKIPNLGQKLDLLLSVRELPSSIADLEPLINQKIRACKQLQDSSRFVAVLEYILAIGNYLNEKGGREKAKGFQLSSLAKLSLLQGKDRNFTLLHALVEQIFLHEPDLAKFSQELTEFKAVSGAITSDAFLLSVRRISACNPQNEVRAITGKGLISSFCILWLVLRKELESIDRCRRLIKPKVIKAETRESQFYKDVKDLIHKYKEELLQLSRRCAEMKKVYQAIMVKFGEAEDRDSEEFFGWISTFVNEFRRASAQIIS
ncbi:hypothetical protein lerEdw1_002076 [Lerista edwardsae]|nr:hypothetical protein lerEdw1_002076 [Lerista edwardsae]